MAVKKDYPYEAMSVGDRWTSGALSFGAAESHRLKVWEIQELHFLKSLEGRGGAQAGKKGNEKQDPQVKSPLPIQELQ